MNPTQLDYQQSPHHVVRGSAVRTLRTMGAFIAILETVVIAAMWVFAKNSTQTKLAATAVIVAFAGVFAAFASMAARWTFARVHEGKLSFAVCGIPTRTIVLDESVAFEIRRLGRLRALTIVHGTLSYVPNNALDQRELVDLLRRAGVAERRAE